ncbi:Aste57867_17596 [Aphanomyces stellatus]|uniref:Aste57867_17596 protein n=1 Tax=Aphanomyces stellatus TaxID=120398 RepID=A0A485L8C0_9STRA|nr:hypothetical protein As57867_017536 [Aphanomyces stellatus]VFT94347.1 Aste57867_17596 [Aphanomyces stellatus]
MTDPSKAPPAGEDRMAESIHTIQTMMKAFVGGGLVGAGWGATIAAIRSDRIGFYAASMGANFALTSASYVTFHEIIAKHRGERDLVSFVLPGTITGGGLLGLLGSPVRAVQGGVVGSFVGAGVFFSSRYFEQWRREVAVERYIAKYGADALPESVLAAAPPLPAAKIDLPSIIPAFVKITDDEIEQRIQARVQQLQDEASNKPSY